MIISCGNPHSLQRDLKNSEQKVDDLGAAKEKLAREYATLSWAQANASVTEGTVVTSLDRDNVFFLLGDDWDCSRLGAEWSVRQIQDDRMLHCKKELY